MLGKTKLRKNHSSCFPYLKASFGTYSVSFVNGFKGIKEMSYMSLI